jgi:hypothetical protein
MIEADCAQARQQISLQADDELSELEQAQLASHLDICAACHSFQTSLLTLSTAMRSAPAAQPPSRQTNLSARRPRTRTIASAVLALGALSLAGTLAPPAHTPTPAIPAGFRDSRLPSGNQPNPADTPASPTMPASAGI